MTPSADGIPPAADARPDRKAPPSIRNCHGVPYPHRGTASIRTSRPDEPADGPRPGQPTAYDDRQGRRFTPPPTPPDHVPPFPNHDRQGGIRRPPGPSDPRQVRHPQSPDDAAPVLRPPVLPPPRPRQRVAPIALPPGELSSHPADSPPSEPAMAEPGRAVFLQVGKSARTPRSPATHRDPGREHAGREHVGLHHRPERCPGPESSVRAGTPPRSAGPRRATVRPWPAGPHPGGSPHRSCRHRHPSSSVPLAKRAASMNCGRGSRAAARRK